MDGQTTRPVTPIDLATGHPGTRTVMPEPPGSAWRAALPASAICRRSFGSVRELADAIDAFTDNWNGHPRLLAWTKDADQILGKIQRAKTKANVLTDH